MSDKEHENDFTIGTPPKEAQGILTPVGEDIDLSKPLPSPSIYGDAKYLLELYFDGKFSSSSSNKGVISIWMRSPSGLIKMYQCPDCLSFVDVNQLGNIGQIIYCGNCNNAHTSNKLIGEIFYKMTVSKWAAKLSKYIVQLQLDVDIALIREKRLQSIIEAEYLTREAPIAGEKALENARDREKALYTRSAMENDIKNGRSLEDAIKSFLLA